MDSVTFLDRLNYLSPYARLTYDLGGGAELDVDLHLRKCPARTWPAPLRHRRHRRAI